MSKKFISLFLNFVILHAICYADCPPGALRGLSSHMCYKVITQETSFLEAETNCMYAQGGHLVSITDGFENNFLAGENFTKNFLVYLSTIVLEKNF
jgi:hypothetical protein